MPVVSVRTSVSSPTASPSTAAPGMKVQLSSCCGSCEDVVSGETPQRHIRLYASATKVKYILKYFCSFLTVSVISESVLTAFIIVCIVSVSPLVYINYISFFNSFPHSYHIIFYIATNLRRRSVGDADFNIGLLLITNPINISSWYKH